MITVHGLKNCDSCRKARRWLDTQGSAHTFVDVRASTPDEATLARWLDAVGADALINRRSTTWRGLDEATRDRILDDPATHLVSHPTLIKRPVLETANGITVGFDADRWSALLR
ncbi:MAG: Spx/MgsR family RNA polymerase-binding regulatory protein [Pseudomonadota bacterium]